MRIKTLLFLAIILLPTTLLAATNVPVSWETYNLYGVTQSNMFIKTSGCSVGNNTTGIFDNNALLETDETSGTLTFSSGTICAVEGVYDKISSTAGGPYYYTVSRDTVDWYTTTNLAIKTDACSVNDSPTSASLLLYSSGLGILNFDGIDCSVTGIYSPTFTAVVASVPTAPEISANVAGNVVTISWTSIADATGYTFFYAPKTAEGHGDIGSIDMGSVTGGAITLWGGASFYIAVQAYNASGPSEFSNISDFTVPVQ